VVVLEHATEPLSAFDFSISGSCIIARLNQLIAQSLMVPFGVIMLDVFTHGVLQWLSSEEDHAIETF